MKKMLAVLVFVLLPAFAFGAKQEVFVCEKKGNDHLNFCLFWLCSLPTCCRQPLY